MSNVVNGKIKKSVKTFIKELENKIVDLDNLREQNKKTNLNYERVCEIIKRYVMGPPIGLNVGDVVLEDLIYFYKKDLEEILTLIGINDLKILNSFESNRDDYRNTRNKKRKSELEEYFESLLDIINKYIGEYNIRYSNKMSFETGKIDKYKKYIEIFSKEEITTLFDEKDYEELRFLMSECSLELKDKINILKYVNLQNIAYKGKEKIEDFNFKSHIYYLINEYLKDDRYVAIVRKNMPVIDYATLVSIPEEGKRISAANNLDKAKTINTLVSIAISSLYEKYQYYLECNKKDETSTIELESIKKAIKMLEGFFVDKEKVTMNFAVNLIVENEELLAKYGDNAEIYLDKTIRELIDNGFTPNEAVQLTLVPLLKSIKETVDVLSNMKDYEKKDERLTYLVELIEMYNETKSISQDRINQVRM